MAVVWPLLAFVLGAFALIEFIAVVRALTHLGDIGADAGHPVVYRAMFVGVQVVLMAGAAVGAYACARQAGRHRRAYTPRPGRDRRPWER